MSPFEISTIVFLLVFGAAMLGLTLQAVLPEHHRSAETKEVVKLGVGLIGTMTALLLGLLVASAKSSYDLRSSELTQMAASIVLLDRALAHYGPETAEIRRGLKGAAARMIEQIWPKTNSPAGAQGTGSGEIIFDEIQELTPHTDAQRAIQSQAESIAISIGQARWLLFEQSGTSISMPFLVVVTFWLSVLFVSFGLFAPRNTTVVVTLFIGALSVAGALFLILELDHPFTGLIQIPSTPMHNALAQLGK